MYLKYLFLSSVFLVFYAYFGYPVSLLLIRSATSRKKIKQDNTFKVSLIITVHNEENRIEEKLLNTISLDYPKEKIQIIVASDGSSDNTNQIVRKYEKYGVILVEIPERRGKEYAQKTAIQHSIGDVVVFSDVATRLPEGSLLKIVSNFVDETVGAVSGEDRIIGKDGRSTGESLYVRYEMWLRRLESDVGSIVGLSGSFFAARREVCEDFSEDMQSDFRTVLNCRRKGLRAISDPESIGYYEDVSNNRKEFERKVRTVLRGLTVFFRNLEFLNVFKHGVFSYQYFCHKLLRWLVPYFTLAAFISNFALMNKTPLYLILFISQITFYTVGIVGFIRNNVHITKIEKISLYFSVVNLAILKAWWKYVSGERIVLWTPSKR